MSLLKRRLLLQYMTATGGLLLFRREGLARVHAGRCDIPEASFPTLDPAEIPKFKQPLRIPGVMPEARGRIIHGDPVDYYEIAVREIQQQILPPGYPSTTVWAYGSVHHPETFSYPGFTIEAKWRRPVWVKWINDLVHPRTGKFLPHLFAVDPTLHWANPPGGLEGRDGRTKLRGPCPPDPYRGPVPIVTHLHGAAPVPQESDGFPEAWYLPKARNIPERFARTGTFYDYFKRTSPLGPLWEPGSAVFQYLNRQPATALWYHDHALGLTRLNVYAGLAGFYMIRGGPDDLPKGVLPGPPPRLGDRPGTRVFEIPLVIQDRSFNKDGSLFYPDSRGLPEEIARREYIPNGDVPPIWVPEFLGNTIVVNGTTWPYLEVERRRYRFRILNGSNTRLLILKLEGDHPIWQIGSDGGFLPYPAKLVEVLLGPAERADVIIDFSDLCEGTRIRLLNVGPEFHGGMPDMPVPPGSLPTGEVMEFRVVRATSKDTSTPPEELELPKPERLGRPDKIRRVSLNETIDPEAGPIEVLLGRIKDGVNEPLHWDAPITENPDAGATEIWEIYNFTADAHPIHLHDVQFQILDRVPFDPTMPTLPPAPGETGLKDTVGAIPGHITRIKVRFNKGGLFVWHCHILEHEDNEMMRPLHVGPIPPDLPFHRHEHQELRDHAMNE